MRVSGDLLVVRVSWVLQHEHRLCHAAERGAVRVVRGEVREQIAIDGQGALADAKIRAHVIASVVHQIGDRIGERAVVAAARARAVRQLRKQRRRTARARFDFVLTRFGDGLTEPAVKLPTHEELLLPIAIGPLRPTREKL